MLNFNVNEEKELTFEVQVGGVSQDQLEGYFRVIVEKVEYGFPVKIGTDIITVNLPPLNKIVNNEIREGYEAEVRLDIIADGQYLMPWQDKAKLSNPVVIEAKIKDDKGSPVKPSLQTRLIVKEDNNTGNKIEELVDNTIKRVDVKEDSSKKKSDITLEEFKQNLNREMIIKYIANKGSKNPKIQDIIYEQAVSEAGSGKPIKVLKQVVKIMKKK